MSQVYTMPVEIRERLGKGGARSLRRQGRIPGVIYGPGTSSVNVAFDPRPLIHLLESGHGENVILELTSPDGTKWSCLLKEYQLDPVFSKLIHADFYAVQEGTRLTVHVPLQLKGESTAVKTGGILEFFLREIEVECLPTDIPEMIEVDITNLGINDYIQVKDLNLPQGVKAVSDPEAIVVLLAAPKEYAVEETVETTALQETPEPEVIRRGKLEEEETAEEESNE